jgi:methyl-accepting chemotaxis protein
VGVEKGEMMRLRDISIKWKVLVVALAGPLIIACIMAWQRTGDIRTNAEKTVIDKSKAIVLMAEATRNEMARKLEIGVIKPFDQIEPSRVVEAVPVVTAMQTAAINAEKSNYAFRVPKVSPRNPKNEPTPFELEILNEISAKNLEEKIVITKDEIRYFKPIKLTKECLFCHGDPKGQIDPTGGKLEGWKAGEVHGAFEIISSLEIVNKEIRSTTLSIALWTISILFVCSIVTWLLLDRSVIRPLRFSSDEIKKVAKKDLTGEIVVGSNDEFGRIGMDLQNMKNQLQGVIKGISSSADILDEKSGELSTAAAQLSSGSNEMNARSMSVATAAEEMSSNMNSVAAATEEASTNIALVAKATKGMAQTITEIARNTENAQKITANAVSEASSASAKVDELGRAASKIGKVTETITEISEQTNLLALNATIEAARAGEAGKGFAVVANEIKDLARQTANATAEIKAQIEEIQVSTSETVGNIGTITNVINEVNETVTEIVRAVEEQNKTTREIAENISQATIGIQEVTENVGQSSVVADEVARDINTVSSTSADVATQSKDTNDSAVRLRNLAKDLRQMIGEFKV